MQHKKKVTRITKFSSPLRYQGNLFFLILFLIFWPPLGMLLLIKNACIATKASKFYIIYHGKWNWLFFWGVFFFPVAFVLLFIKGVDFVNEETVIEE